MPKKLKIAIGLSGGVDSAVAAKILKDQGHEVIALFLKLWSDPLCKIKGENRCCDQDALDDARRVAQKLDIPFYVINARDKFKKDIVDNFLEEYKNLRTPNPCIICNEKIKFDLMLQKALTLGCEKLATGHYARIVEHNSEMTKSEYRMSNKISKIHNSYFSLHTSADSSKDQTYMLYRLNQKQLSYSLFPLGKMRKAEVRVKVVEWDMPVKEKPESQEICFFGDKDYREFLKRYLSKDFFKPGDIVTSDGKVVGEHEGLVNYTIGQRRGVNQEMTKTKLQMSNKMSKSKTEVIASKARQSDAKQHVFDDLQPLYVIGFNISKNQLIVGDDKEVYKKEMTVTDVHWISSCHPELVEGSLKVKIRYGHDAVACKVKVEETTRPDTDDNIRIIFDKPQRAITPGQSAVFYKDDEVLGGGIIK